MTRTISTPEELDALPVGSVVMCDDEHGVAKRVDADIYDGYDWLVVGSDEYRETHAMSWALPATVLYDPSAKPAPDPDDRAERNLVFQALGAASMCWENVSGAGVFDSTRASQIGDNLMSGLRSRRLAVTPEMIEAGAEVLKDVTGEPRAGRFERTMTRAVLEAALETTK